MSEQEQIPENHPQPINMELCFNAAPVLDAVLQEQILQALSIALGGELGAIQHRVLTGPAESSGLLLMPERLNASENGPACLLVCFDKKKLEPTEPSTLLSLSQTWQWDDADEVAPAAAFRVYLSEVNTLHLGVEQRVLFFQKTLHALTGLLKPAALHFPQSQCFIDPAAFLENAPSAPDFFLIYGLVNNRIFTAEDEDDKDVFMDTLGLHLLGLPDIQCYVRAGSLNYEELAYWMYNLADYVRENPSSIGDGDVVIGLDEAEWDVRMDKALIGPERAVLDINTLPDEEGE